MIWSSEHIPDEHALYMRVHRNVIEGNQIPAGVFRDDGSGMSTDWAKYARPEDTRRRGAKPPSEYAVISLFAGYVRTLAPPSVVHSPITPSFDVPDGNRAHADILGLYASSKADKVEFRLLLWRGHQMRIRLTDPVND